jgi:hypothetical protein
MRKTLSLCVFGLLTAGTAQAGGQPPEPLPLSPAVAIHVSPAGLQALGDSIEGIVPEGITATGLSGELVCDEETGDPLIYSADDITIRLSADDVSIIPSTDRLDIVMGLTIWSEDADITVEGPCVIELAEQCTLSLPPTPLDAELGIQIALEDGELITNVTGLQFTHGNFGNPIETGCLLGDALETMQGLGVDLLGTILDDVLDSQIGELEAQLDELVGGLTAALAFEDELDVGGFATLGYSLEASELEISNDGLVILMDAKFTTPEYGDCVPQGPAYVATSHDMPLLTGNLPGTDVPYHVAIHASEDLLNQALFALWQGGMFCIHLNEMEQVPAELLDTNVLVLAGLTDEETAAQYWPEAVPLDLFIKGDEPPTVTLAGGPTLYGELALDVMGMEQDRLTRFWGNGVFLDGGFDMELDGQELLLDIQFDLETSIGWSVAYNEWLPPDFAEGFGPALIGLAGSFLDLETLIPSSFILPQVFGLGVSDLDMRIVGDSEDWLGLYAWVDPSASQPMELGDIDLGGLGCGDTGDGGDISIPGCEDLSSGCGDSGLEGCSSEDGGCGGCGDSSGGCGGCEAGHGYRVGGRTVFALLVPLLLIRRRQR